MIGNKFRWKKNNFVKGLFLATALSTAAISPPAAAHGGANSDIQIYAASKYTYCDAKMLAAVWGGSVGDAKTRIGNKIAYGGDYVIQSELERSRAAGNKCFWSDIGYSYQDAQKIASLWQLRDISFAKTKMATLATAGKQDWVDAALQNTIAPTPSFSPSNEQKASVFFGSQYSYCDAKLVAALWGVDVYSGKIGIGDKIIGGNGHYVPKALAASRRAGNQCEWSDLPYSYEDAQRIAAIWNRPSVSDAKSKMTMLANAGHQNWVEAALSR